MSDITFDPVFAFLFQGFLFVIPLLGSYIAYRRVRAPRKNERDALALIELGVDETALKKIMPDTDFKATDYLWPITFLSLLTFIIYSITHPFVIGTGLWEGVLEETVNIVGIDNVDLRAEISGRFLFWGWFGAYIYSFYMIWRRFLNYDLTPSVYVYAANRFALSLVIGAITGTAVGVLSDATAGSFDGRLTSIYVVIFSIGFFPERGLDWISAISKRIIGSTGGIAKETRLSELEGLSIWHQGRLKQEGIENVQNLATADIPLLIIGTPFTVGQIIDWIDQGILMVYANEDVYPMLDKTGIRCASDFITVGNDDQKLTDLVDAIKIAMPEAQINKQRLKTLHLAIQSATNIQATTNYRWQASLDAERRQIAATMTPFQDAPTRRTSEMKTIIKTQEEKTQVPVTETS